MKYRTVLLGAVGALALAACSEDKPAAELSCNSPAVAQSLQQQLQQTIAQSARQFAQTDNRQFVDADKIIAAASQLTVSLDKAQTDNSGSKPVCSAQLNVAVAPATWQQAEANTPILYPQQQLLPLLQGQLTGSAVQLSGSTFSQPLRYVPADNGAASTGADTLQIEAPGVAQLSHILTNALLPYGVKDILLINGKPYNRADALKIINNPNAQPAEPLSPEAAAASAILNGAALPPEPATPAEPGTPTEATALSADKLQQAQDNNRQANNTVNDIWRNMDDMVRGELQNEQRQWINQKTSQCRQAAGNDSSAAENEYRRLQCDTRLTNERIDYLRGFSVP